ncbi:uncharacterized protein Z519_06932 [Cladophialophora bantiana CBS 173.52]|uniref:Transcription factor domain-containing protein n=1 Tax=Cladophialophora bantiana (strain ATCC 10958 / CBS 173.52 / CDC B-1940 / NIH 8579) TaxID=1442370 RepID=A0A0D2HME2_CLAB1|nr:uncharacterized protein Z519_06932 [Cladophialophora bantiana CBS 173.52]KIW91950.1 hypothetical protein Z519_06932 [Cladophialophora bantiana CBS 173.52]
MASGQGRDISHASSVPSPNKQTSTDPPTTCGVCRRPGCQLRSHRAYLVHRSRSGAATKKFSDKSDAPGKGDHQRPKLLETSYARSYAYTRALPSLGAGRLDGFHDLPVPGGHQLDLHQAVYNLLHSKIGAATAFPLPAGLTVNEIGGSMVIPVMTDTSLCLSVIAAWKAVQFLMGQITAFPHLSYEAQALQSLRQKLLDKEHAAVTDEAVLSATLLWATATMFAQPEALRRHAAGVQALVAARGGLNTIGRGGSIGQAASIRQLILWADFLTAQFLGEDVLFKDIGPSDESPMPPSLVKLSRTIVIPPPFDVLGPETLKAARDMKLLLVSHNTATRTGRLSIAEYKALMSILNNSTIERISLAYRLRNSQSMDETVLLAMNLLRLTTLFHAGPLFVIMVAVISRLRRALARMTMVTATATSHTFPGSSDGGATTPTTTNRNRIYIDVYIWACFVGLVNIFDSENRSHFVEMLGSALTAKYRDAGGWPDDWQGDTLSMLRSFLWSDVALTNTGLYQDACQMVESHILSPTNTGSTTDCPTDTWSEKLPMT